MRRAERERGGHHRDTDRQKNKTAGDCVAPCLFARGQPWAYGCAERLVNGWAR